MPFVLLIFAIAAVWLPSLRLRGGLSVPLWVPAYAAALVAAVAQGCVGLVGVAALVAMAVLAEAVRRRPMGALYWPLFGLLLVLALALTLHQVPGFHNPMAINGVRFSEDARPFTQYLNFDKGSVGLILLAVLAPRLGRQDAVALTLGRSAVLAVAVAAVVLGAAAAVGMVRLDPKWPPQAAKFLMANLFLTCVAEEALFRVLVQDPLSGARVGSNARGASAWNNRSVLAVVLSAALFGAAHAGGGIWMIVVAGLAGVGYAATYAWLRRIEVAVVVHFGVNAAHFLLFTYPGLRG
ncbi:CPBP family intramembrane glutamic endopeptidase [Roseateles sp. YR242]|uniref:CPBP family intramembrane glutamic endopeptidase n=1 Tax=Roseateles sp. YR242 TaxID=1855305 RepID=UPI001C431634|nr:CPBP family intramembrane glutamic endopeptidase [Roseateles sp. YR242]